MTATDTLPAACAVSPPPSAPQPASASSASCNVTGYDIQKEASSVVEGDCAVHLASHRESVQKVSVRVYHKACLSQERLQQLHDQTALLADLHHENIVHLVAAYEDAEDVYIILEQSLEQDSIAAVLQRRGGRLTESQAVREVLQPLLSALQCVYAQHGAVRPLLDPSHIHLSDKLKVQLLPSIQPATPAADATPCACDYQPPEQLGGPMMPDADIAAQADVWALGVLAFTIVTGKSPFAGASPQQTQRSVRTCDPALPSWLSAHAKAFISSALKKDASKRAGLVDLLKHPWIATRQRRSSGLTLIKADWQAAADPCAVAARLKEREFEGHPGRCQVDLFTASSGELLGDHSLALSAASSLEGAQPGSFSHSMHSTSQRALGAGVGLGMHLSLRPAVSLPEGGLPQWPEAAAARTHAQMRTAAASRRDHTLRPLSMDAIREGALAIPGSLHGSQPSSPKPFVFGSFGLAQQIDEIAHKAAGGRQAADAADGAYRLSRLSSDSNCSSSSAGTYVGPPQPGAVNQSPFSQYAGVPAPAASTGYAAHAAGGDGVQNMPSVPSPVAQDTEPAPQPRQAAARPPWPPSMHSMGYPAGPAQAGKPAGPNQVTVVAASGASSMAMPPPYAGCALASATSAAGQQKSRSLWCKRLFY